LPNFGVKDFHELSKEALLHQAEQAKAKGKYKEAVRCLNVLIERQPGDAELLLQRGVNQASSGVPTKRKLAIADFNLALEYAKERELKVKILFERALTHKFMWKTKEAINDFGEVLELDPSHVQAAFEIGMMFRENLEFKSALEYFEKVLEVDPVHENALLYCYRCYQVI